MVVVGAFVLLGWIGVALASATNASAETGSGTSSAIDGLLAPAAPLLDDVSAVLGQRAPSTAHHASHARATVARSVHAAAKPRVTKAASAPTAVEHASHGPDHLTLVPLLADLFGSTGRNDAASGALISLERIPSVLEARRNVRASAGARRAPGSGRAR